MKKIFLAAAICLAAFMQQGFAQSVPVFREDSAATQNSPLLTSYYNLKEALVKSNSNAATESAKVLVKAVEKIDKEKVKAESRNALLADAGAIAQSKDLKVQREKFATLSVNMFALAKTLKLSAEPIYQQYCPMKKAYWLSSEAAIKNPYYGNQMLSCGKLTETLK